MGLQASIPALDPVKDYDSRLVFVQFEEMNRLSEAVFYKYSIRYQRYKWSIAKRFSDFKTLDVQLRNCFPQQMAPIPVPVKKSKIFWSHSDAFLKVRGENLSKYMALVLDRFGALVFSSIHLKQFIEVGPNSFRAEMGRKGKEGFLQKSSGGYLTNFSSTLGDYFKFWNTRYIVLKDNHIAYYRSYEEVTPSGSLQIDQGLQVWTSGRLINVRTLTRRLILFARSKREAEDWRAALEEFYTGSVRRLPHKHGSSYAPRPQCPLRVYTCGRDYFGAVTAAMLGAQKEIYIASWMVSPHLWLTRPPNPPIRLDQLLKFKAEQGVKIYVLLYQEVEMAKQGNDSNRCKNILELLCPSMIFVIRHPNKLMGGSTALLWSHHEKIVVVDRTAAFIGGIDLAFGRYDDGEHLLVDEDGWRFPGGDYYQPGEGRFNPVPPPAALQSVTQRAGSMSSVRAEDVVAEYMNDTSTAESAVVISVTPFEALGPFSRASPSSSLPEDIAFPISDIQCPNDIDETESVSDLGDDYQQPLQAEEIRALQEAEEERGDLGGELYLNQTFALDELPVASVVYAAVLPEAERETIASTIASGRDKDDKLIEKKKNVWNFDSIVDAISGFSDAVVKSTGKGAAGESVAQLRPRRGVMRDMFPRMPWHDIQAYVGGLAARDISSHFIQRWNHHRLSKGSNKAHVFTEITDNPHFGVCARCLAAELSQDCKLCPRCNHDLGPRGCYFEFDALDKQGQLALRVPGRAIHPFIVFRCVFESKLGCRIQGTGPVLITSVLDPDLISRLPEGQLLREHLGGEPEACWTDISTAAPARFRDGRLPTASTSISTSTPPLAPVAAAVSGTVLSMKPPPATTAKAHPAGHVATCITSTSVLSLDITGILPEDDANQKIIAPTKLSVEVATLNASQRTLKPMVGDILESVNGVPVSHMDFAQVQRLLLRHKFIHEVDFRKGLCSGPMALEVVFKRIFVNDIDEIRTHDSETMENVRLFSTPADTALDEVDLKVIDDPRLIALAEAPVKTSLPKVLLKPRLGPMVLQTTDDNDIGALTSSEQLPSAGRTPTSSPTSSHLSPTAAVVTTDGPQQTRLSVVLNRETRSNTTASAKSSGRQITPMDQYIRDRALEKKSLICRATTARELDYRFLSFYRRRTDFISQDVMGNLSTTCQVQVLRSVGAWSIGHRTEKSILECWKETISAALHFVYIENQFFLSSLAGGAVQNTLAQVLLDKLVSAATEGRVFRAVVVIPLHPEGDFLNAAPVRHVMHFQYATICRGARSLLEQFQKRAPNAVVSDYISFFSLRNWGILNGEVVTDQIYVHDKLLIADDRVVVMGSANFNDRSMLGDRDSEMAIRIEDTAHKAIRMNGQPFYVGELPHKLRTSLMRRHIGNSGADVSDPICVNTYYNLLMRTAVQNSNIYSALDGPLSSFDKAATLAQYNEGILEARALQAADENTRILLESIVGQIVLYPLTFLKGEDLGPSLASKTVVPTDLWV